MEAIILILVACAVICAVVAPAKGRSALLWLLLGLAFGLVPVIILAMLPARPREGYGGRHEGRPSLAELIRE